MNREQVIEWACEGGFPRNLANQIADVLEHVAQQAAAAEREECAKVCEALQDFAELEKATKAAIDAVGTERELDRLRHQSDVSLYNTGMRNCATAIRTRGQKEGV